MDIVALAKKRYTTKNYDGSKTIPEDQFQQLCTLLRYAPSSVNSQPWHFIVAHTAAAKSLILPAITEFNHPRIKNTSHVIVFCARTAVTDDRLQQLLIQEEKDGRFPSEENKTAQDTGRRFFTGLNNTSPQALLNWEGKQVYLALGMLLLGAASLGIDATPMEGFDAKKMDAVLDLAKQGLTSVVVASLGYRSHDDFNAGLPKSRLTEENVFTFLP